MDQIIVLDEREAVEMIEAKVSNIRQKVLMRRSTVAAAMMATHVRFMLGDFGIVPTAGMEKKLSKKCVPWMTDRLDAWLQLLSDVDILETASLGLYYSVGKNARWV